MKPIRWTALLMCLACWVAAAAAASDGAPSLGDFAQRSRLDTPANTPFQRLELPATVYTQARQPRLGDLRVFNAQGEPVPYAIVAAHERTQAPRDARSEQALVVFDWTGSREPDNTTAVDIERRADGTLISLRERHPTSAPAAVTGVLLDTGALTGAQALRLGIDPQGKGLHGFVVEDSADLQHWRTLLPDAQWVRLEQDGHRIERDTVQWDAPAQRYLRILWQNPGTAPRVRAAWASRAEAAASAAPLSWVDAPPPSTSAPRTFDFDWGAAIDVQRARIRLPAPNLVVPFELRRPVSWRSPSGTRQETRWEPVTQTVAYRLQQPQGEVWSPDISVANLDGHRLRLVMGGSGADLAGGVPTLQLGFEPSALLFLARGPGPYTLAWGSDRVSSGDWPATTLVPGYDGSDRADVGLAHWNTPQASPTAAGTLDRSGSHRRWLLWGVLVLGLLVIVGMGRSLLRTLRP